MKVLLIVTNLVGGGAEKAMLKIAKGLSDRSHNVHLLILEDCIDYTLPEGVSLHTLLASGRKVTGSLPQKWLMAYKLRQWYRSFAAFGSIDLTISTLPLTDELVRLAQLPDVVYRIANTLSAEIEMIARESRYKATRRMDRYNWLYEGQEIIAVSKGVANDLRYKLELKAARIHTIYNPFDFQEIRELAAIPMADLPHETYVLHVGRFSRQKRHDVLFDAYLASQVPHRLVLLTHKSPDLLALIAERGLQSRVIVAGFQKNPYPWYAKASAVVLSSDFEGMPNVLVEALACGTPVVSTNCPSGPREVLTGEMARYLVDCGDSAALAARLREVVESPPNINPASIEPFRHNRAIEMIEDLAKEK